MIFHSNTVNKIKNSAQVEGYEYYANICRGMFYEFFVYVIIKIPLAFDDLKILYNNSSLILQDARGFYTQKWRETLKSHPEITPKKREL